LFTGKSSGAALPGCSRATSGTLSPCVPRSCRSIRG